MGQNSMTLLDRIAKRRAALTDRIKDGKPFVCPVTRRYAQQISKDKLGYSDQGSSLLGVDEATASARFVISTQRQDRDGDVVISTGVQLENFRKNPVVLYGHGQDPVYGTLPIGKVTAIDVRKNHIEATLQFDVADPRAMTVFRKIADGYLNATSIGFMPLAGEELSSEYWYPGVRFDSWELLEVSVVPTPANSEATLVGRSINNAKVLPIMATKQKWRKHKAVAKEFPPKEDSKPEGVPAMEADTAKQAPQTDIQAILCPKAQYADVNAATQWVTNHGFDASQPVEQPDAWAFVQFNADECDAATAESQDLGDGVTGVKCNSRVDPNKVHGDVPPNNDPGVEGKSMRADCGGACTCKTAKAVLDTNVYAPEALAAIVAKATAEAFMKFKADGMSNDDVPSTPETPPDEAADDTEKRPHSYRCLQALIAHVEEHMPQMDQPKVKAFYESILSKAKSLMNSVHGEGEASDDEMMDNDEDSDEEAKSLDWARIMPALESVRANQQRLNDGLALAMGRVP